jgi:hypothetical protein
MAELGHDAALFQRSIFGVRSCDRGGRWQGAQGLCIERCFQPDTPAVEAGRKARR